MWAKSHRVDRIVIYFRGLVLPSDLTKLWTQGFCRCCHCGQNQDNQGLDLEPWEDPRDEEPRKDPWDDEPRKYPWDEDHHPGHPPSGEAAWRANLRLRERVTLFLSLSRLIQLITKFSEFCFCSIRHHLCFLYGGDVVRCFLRPHKLQSPLKIQKYQYLSVKQSEKWSLLKGFTIHLWNMRLLWSPAASVLLSLSLYTNYCCFTAWARYEFETWATPWSSLTGLMSQARHQIAPWQMVV